MEISEHLNILNKKQQSALLKLVKKKITKLPNKDGMSFPSLQTAPDLHHYKELEPLVEKLKEYIKRNFNVVKCWSLYTEGEESVWHHHTTDLTVVYYLKNKEFLGTVFFKKNKMDCQKGPENSLIIFKDEVHRPPLIKKGTPKLNRYTVSLDISFKT